MDPIETFATYCRASDAAWETFLAYKFGNASEHEVHMANRKQEDARLAHEKALEERK